MHPTPGSFSALPKSPNNSDISREPARKFIGTDRPKLEPETKVEKIEEGVKKINHIQVTEDDKLDVVAPWTRSVDYTQQSLRESQAPRGSSVYLGDRPFTGGAQVLSTQKYVPAKNLFLFVLMIVLLSLPVGALVWGSYQGWPSYLPIPKDAQLVIDKLIAQSPLPNTPLLLLNPSFNYLKSLKTFGYQFDLTVEHNLNGQKFSSIFTGKVDNKEKTKLYAVNSTSWWQSGSEAKTFVNGDFQYQGGKLEIFVKEAGDAGFFHWPMIVQKPLAFTVNPTPDSGESSSPGEFALTKIRNQKLARLIGDYQKIIVERAYIPEETDLSNLSPDYVVFSELSKEEVVNFIKELTAIYQESQPRPIISQTALQKFYQQLEEVVDDLKVEVHISKQSLLLENIQFITNFYTHKLPEFAEESQYGSQNWQLINGSSYFTVKGKMNILEPNQPVVFPVSPKGQSDVSVNWTEVITHPWLIPLLQR